MGSPTPTAPARTPPPVQDRGDAALDAAARARREASLRRQRNNSLFGSLENTSAPAMTGAQFGGSSLLGGGGSSSGGTTGSGGAI